MTVDITIVHLVTGHFAPLLFLLQFSFPQLTLCLVDLISKYKNLTDTENVIKLWCN